LEPKYRHAEAVKGLEKFSHLWLIWEFSANSHTTEKLTVRPPRLGGNERVGVFASRSPFRPNRLGLTSATIEKVDYDVAEGPVITVLGADLMDGTPIYDIKPYVAYSDSHPDARSGFVDEVEWEPLKVKISNNIGSIFSEEQLTELREILSFDPRPQFHDDETRIYGMPFAGYDIHFRVYGQMIEVVEAKSLK
jgi:tRNA-Thr(GGU) m(6)t(6)A37 methyltransferase TsaA